MEGATSTIVYTPEEEKDAQKTLELVNEEDGQLELIQTDLRDAKRCKEVVDKAVKTIGGY